MKCYFCGKEMIWMDDKDLEDIDVDRIKGTVSRFLCINKNCNATAEFIKEDKNI